MSQRNYAILAIVLTTLLSCGTKTSTKQQEFECSKFYLPKDLEWEFAYDEVKFTSAAVIVQDERTNEWAVLFPGSLTLNNDTIYVNQEAGYQNECRLFGQLTVGDSAGINLTSYILKEDYTYWFHLTSSSTPKFQGKEYCESKYLFANGCWCDWYV